MAAASLNLTIEQGTDFEVAFTVRNKNGAPLNLLSYTATSSLKKHYTSTITYPFAVTFIDRSKGRISISMAHTQTSTISGGRYVYDVVLISPSGTKTRALEGFVIVSPGVS
jgi:hypothetical protein